MEHVLHRDPGGAVATPGPGRRKPKPRAKPVADGGGSALPDGAAVPGPTAELDLRGTRVEEALNRLEPFLDQALLNGCSQVRIIHGMGTGALRAAVRERLGGHPAVSRWSPEEGRTADGATIAELA